MSYASASCIALPVGTLPGLHSRAARHALHRGAGLAIFAGQSLVMAATLWLLLAGPALLSSGAEAPRTHAAAGR